VKVTLVNARGAVVATATTDADGLYQFTQLEAGTYTVKVSGVPSGFTATYDLDGISSAHRATFSLAAGEDKLDVDFGYALPTGSVCGTIWSDANRNGKQDRSEAGIAGVTVFLTDGNGATIATVTTDKNGKYLFSQVPAGRYSITVSGLPAGLAPTYDVDGVNSPNTATIKLSAGENKQAVDFGYGPAFATVSGRVWNDLDRDGVQDAGESGLKGVKVTLLNARGTTIATTTTDANGRYQFAQVEAGTYTVTVSSVPSGYTATYDLDGVSSAGRATFSVSAGQDKREVDFGYAAPNTGTLKGRVWFDENLNGKQDSRESGLACVWVNLYSANGTLVARTQTNSDGSYKFDNVKAGSYVIRIEGVASGLTATYDLDGVDTAGRAAVTVTGGLTTGLRLRRRGIRRRTGVVR
jgi:serine-aspartate repeat-containing protein C/D/E